MCFMRQAAGTTIVKTVHEVFQVEIKQFEQGIGPVNDAILRLPEVNDG